MRIRQKSYKSQNGIDKNIYLRKLKNIPPPFHQQSYNCVTAVQNLNHGVVLVSVTLERVLGGAELVAGGAVVAGRDVGQVLGLDVALDGAVVLGGVAAHRTLQRPVGQPVPPGRRYEHYEPKRRRTGKQSAALTPFPPPPTQTFCLSTSGVPVVILFK